MSEVSKLIEAAKQASGAPSDAAFARQLGVSRGTIANWRSGYSLPDTITCATLAGLTGKPLAQVLGIVGEARAISREEKAVWRKLATSVGLLLVLVGGTFPARAHVVADPAYFVVTAQMPLMSDAQGVVTWIAADLGMVDQEQERCRHAGTVRPRHRTNTTAEWCMDTRT